MSRSESTKIIAGLTAWVLVGVVGFVYFWLHNPERQFNKVISKPDLELLDYTFVKTLSQQAALFMNDGQDAVSAPERLGNTELTPGARDAWLTMLAQADRNARTEMESYFSDPTGLEYDGLFHADYDRLMGNDATMQSDGDVVLEECITINGKAHTASEENQIYSYVCGRLVIDKESKQIKSVSAQ